PKLAFRAGKGCLCLLHTLPKIAKSVKLLFQHFETMPNFDFRVIRKKCHRSAPQMFFSALSLMIVDYSI
ncbi:MAG: hypothetical protein AB1797_11730, partial [bacterium]